MPSYQQLWPVRFWRYTTAQRDAIWPNPPNGLVIFNVTTDQLEIYLEETWQAYVADPDAGDITYTPGVLTDWDSDADPGDLDDALDQLAERVDDVEGGVLGDHDHTGDAGDGGTLDLLADDDGDTKVQVEESADEDIIRLDAAGTELMTIGHDGAVDIFHTAAAGGEHGLELIVDAAGSGNIHALDIVLTTGAIGAGDDEEAILVNIDESAAGGGNVVALEVLATEGSADVHAVEAGVLVGPVLQLSGTFMDMDVALVKAVDRLTEFITSGNNIVFFVADTDTITIGDAGQFFEIEFLLDTVASKDVKPTFEYSKAGGLWEPFFPADGTNGMQNTGVIAWEADDVASPAWVVHAGNYRIRITRTKGGSITSPIEDKVQIAAVTVFEWDKSGDVTINSLSTDTIGERTAAAGVTIDSLLIKDGAHGQIGGTSDLHTEYTKKATLTAQGDLYAASGASTPARLALSVPAANVRNVLGVDNGESDPSWKTALDATNPADTAASASPGTALPFSHRDHAHKLHDHDHTGDAGDGAQISHDSALTGVSADDHHAQAHGPSDHTAGNAWKVVYQDTNGDEQEVALGADGTFFQANGEAAAPTFAALVVADIPFDDGTSDPVDTTTAAADGTEASPARKDHAHKLHDHDHTGDAGDGAQIAGATALSDIGITDDDMVQVDGPGAGAPANGEYAKWTANGLEGKAAAEVRSDLSVIFERSITVEDPTSSEDITICFTNRAITITEMRAVLIGTANGQTVTWTIRHHATDRSNAGNEVVTNGTTTTSLTAGSDVTSFNDATIPADSFIWLETTAKGGTVTELHITLIGTID